MYENHRTPHFSILHRGAEENVWGKRPWEEMTMQADFSLTAP